MISVIPGMIENVFGPNRDLPHKERDSCLNIARELKSKYNGASHSHAVTVRCITGWLFTTSAMKSMTH